MLRYNAAAAPKYPRAVRIRRLSTAHDNAPGAARIQEYLELTDGELARVRGKMGPTRDYLHASMVDERLEPLRERLGLSKKELKKMVLSSTASLTTPHDSLLTKLDRLQGYLELTDAELKKIVIGLPPILGLDR